MSAASLASFVIGKLTSPDAISDASDMTDRREASTAPRLTTVWRARSIPYNIPDEKQRFRSEGSLLRILRARSMPQLGLPGTIPQGRTAASPRSESQSPVRHAPSRGGASMQSSGHVSDASESTVPSLATPPPTPRSPSPSSMRRSRSRSDGHLWQERRKEVRQDTDMKAVALPSVKSLRGKFESKDSSPQGDQQPARPGQPDDEVFENDPETGRAPDRRWVTRHNSLLRREPKSPERQQPPKSPVTAASVTKRLQQIGDSPQDQDEAMEVFLMTDHQDLRDKSRSEASLRIIASQAQEPRLRPNSKARQRLKNHRRSKSEPDPSSVQRFHAQSSPPSVKKLKMLFEKDAEPDSSHEPPSLSPRKTLRERTPDLPQPKTAPRKTIQEATVVETATAEVVHVVVSEVTVPTKVMPQEKVDPVISGTPSVRNLRWRFETVDSDQPSKYSAETSSRPSRAVVNTLRTPFEKPQPRQARSVSPDKQIRTSLTGTPSASVKNLLKQFEALSPVESLRDASGRHSVDEGSRRSPPRNSTKNLQTQSLDVPKAKAQHDATAAQDKITFKAEVSRPRLMRQSRTSRSSSSSSSSSSDEEETKDVKQKERERERRRKEEEKEKEKQRIEKERLALEQQRKEKEEQERTAREEKERKEREEKLRKEKEEKARKEREEKERREREEKERKEKEEKLRKEKEERERKEREEKARKEREEKERREREEKERKEREAKLRKEKEEKERKEREEKLRKEKEEKERKEREEKARKEKEKKRKESDSSSSSSSDEEETKRELERKKKEEERTKERERIEQQQRKEKERKEKEEKERKEREEKLRKEKEEKERKEREEKARKEPEEKERREREEKERKEREEKERKEREEKLRKEKEEKARKEKEEKERREREEKERKEREEKARKEREEKERKEKEEKLRKEKEEKERKEREEKARKEREEKERREREEKERKEREEKLRKEKEEKERKEREEKARKEKEKKRKESDSSSSSSSDEEETKRELEKKRIQQQQQALEQQRKEKERKEREEKERKEREEKERKEREEKERKEREEKERKEREEKKRKEREEKERKEREEKEKKEREKAEEEKRKREKAEQERRVREEAERKKQEEEKRRKQREKEETERLQREAEQRQEQEKRKEEEKKRREELVRRLSSETPKEVILETRKKSKTESQSSDSDSSDNDKGTNDGKVKRKVQAMIGRLTQQGQREATSPPRVTTSPPREAAASSDQTVGRLVDQFTNLKDADLDAESRQSKADEDEDERRSSDVSALVKKFRKMNEWRRSSSSSSSSDTDGDAPPEKPMKEAPEKPKKEEAPIPTIPTRTSVPGKVRTLRADELRFFETSSGDGGTGAFMRTQSLRGKKSEPFTKPRFGSLRGSKSRVAVLSTSSSTNAALPKNCRRLNTDEMRFFTGEVTNIYRSSSSRGRGSKTTRMESRPPAEPQGNTNLSSEEFFRLAGQGRPAPEANGHPAPSEDDSDSEPSVLRGGEKQTDSEGEIYEMDITLRSDTDADDPSDTEQLEIDHPMSLLLHSIQDKLLQPVEATGAADEDRRCYVVFSPGRYLTSSDEEDDHLAPKYPLVSSPLTENVPMPTFTENRGPPVVLLDETPPHPAAVLPDASTEGREAGKDTVKHSMTGSNTTQHLASKKTDSELTTKTSSQTAVFCIRENGAVIDYGETEGTGRPVAAVGEVRVKELQTCTQMENDSGLRPSLTRGKGVDEADSSEDEEEKRKEEKNERKEDTNTSVTVNEIKVRVESKEMTLTKETKMEVIEVVNEKKVNILTTETCKRQDRKEETMQEMKHEKHQKAEEKKKEKENAEMPHKKQEVKEEVEQMKEVVAAKEVNTEKPREYYPRIDPDEAVDPIALGAFMHELDVLNSKPDTSKPKPTPASPKTREYHPRIDTDEKVDPFALGAFMDELEDLNSRPATLMPLLPTENPATNMTGNDSSGEDSGGKVSSSEDSSSEEEEEVLVARKAANVQENYQRIDPDEDVDPVALAAFLDELEELNSQPPSYPPPPPPDSPYQPPPPPPESPKTSIKTKEYHPRIDPDEKVDPIALGAFMDELEKLNSQPSTMKPPPPRENKTSMNGNVSNEDGGLSIEELKGIEEQIIPLASFQGLSASPKSPSGTRLDTGSHLKDSNTPQEVTRDLVSEAPPSRVISAKDKMEIKGKNSASSPLLVHSSRQEEEEKTVQERKTQTFASPPLPESLKRKKTEKGAGSGTRDTPERGEGARSSPQEQETCDIITGKQFIKFCIFSIWFSAIMYFARDFLS